MTSRFLHETLFIIGAGAHVPYEMPSGKELKQKIKEMYRHRDYISFAAQPADEIGQLKWQILTSAFSLNILKKAQKEVNQEVFDSSTDKEYRFWFDKFLRSFSESHVLSIDTYLASLSKETDLLQRAIFELFGKLTIAIIVIYYETSSPLGVRKDDWIHTFINLFLKNNPEKFFKNSPKIITFNYDRIFERMLYTHLIEFHKYDHGEAKSQIEKLDILHVYGCIGDFTQWNDLSSNSEFLTTACESIRVIGEERDRFSNIEGIIHTKFEASENIYFLGYGYDEINNTLLKKSFKKHNWNEYKKVYSTTIGLRKSDLNRIQNSLKYSKMISLDGDEIVAIDCDSLIAEIAPLRSF